MEHCEIKGCVKYVFRIYIFFLSHELKIKQICKIFTLTAKK